MGTAAVKTTTKQERIYLALRERILLGNDATKDTVVRALDGATHIHLACHGYAAMQPEALDARLFFRRAGGAYRRRDPGAHRVSPAPGCTLCVRYRSRPWLRRGRRGARHVDRPPRRGAAGVISTLWPVDDYATALLMCRFYELLALQGEGAAESPARALREAQRWLRDLTLADERRLLAERPLLKQSRDVASGVRGVTEIHDPRDTRRFADPGYWAGFVFSGA
jgi:CHAT domain-containing protein